MCLMGDGYIWPFKDSTQAFPLVFISHSSLDKEIVEQYLPVFDDKLSSLCSYNIWYDKWAVKSGKNIQEQVEKEVEESDIVLLFISKNSLESGWVEKEWRQKYSKEIETGKISVIAVIIDTTTYEEIPPFLRSKCTSRLSGINSQ